MEEWLDDNKQLLGTIGMVILVVQVRRLIDKLLFHSPFLPASFSPVCFPPCFFVCCFVSRCICLRLPVWLPWASRGLCATIKLRRGLCSVGVLGTHTSRPIEVTVFCTVILSGRTKATWLRDKQAVVTWEPSAEALNMEEHVKSLRLKAK